jgi:hypothetical protein
MVVFELDIHFGFFLGHLLVLFVERDEFESVLGFIDGLNQPDDAHSSVSDDLNLDVIVDFSKHEKCVVEINY